MNGTWGTIYTDPQLVGWRYALACSARKHAALVARSNRLDARSRRIMAERVAEALVARESKKR